VPRGCSQFAHSGPHRLDTPGSGDIPEYWRSRHLQPSRARPVQDLGCPDAMTLRLPLLLLIMLTLLGLPGVARAQQPGCSNQLIHDWYRDGRIDGRYRVSCYRAALVRVPSDLIYGTIRQDISNAFTSGLNRVREQGASVAPRTILASPVRRSSPSSPNGKSTSWLLSVAAAAALGLMLIAWCVSRWRSTRPPTGTG
jgi:hypothetical protein